MCTLDNGMEEFHTAYTGFHIREVQIFLSRRFTVLDLENSADYAAVDIGDCDIIALRMTKRHTSQFTCGYINTIAGTVERAGSFTLFDIDYFIRAGLTPLQATLGTHDSKLDFIGAATSYLSEPVCTMCAVIIFQNNIIIQIKLFAEGISGGQQALNLQAGDIVDQMLHMRAIIRAGVGNAAVLGVSSPNAAVDLFLLGKQVEEAVLDVVGVDCNDLANIAAGNQQ